MDTEVVGGSKVRAKGSETIAQESILKRAGVELEQEKAKKQRIDNDQEEAEMKKLMEIVPDEEEVAVEAILKQLLGMEYDALENMVTCCYSAHVTENDAVDVIELAINRHTSDLTTRTMCLIALLKLSSRFPSCSQSVHKFCSKVHLLSDMLYITGTLAPSFLFQSHTS
ncbi:AP-1 complex subunit gamma-2-like protein isoform X1 [Tanacetum coccineum]